MSISSPPTPPDDDQSQTVQRLLRKHFRGRQIHVDRAAISVCVMEAGLLEAVRSVLIKNGFGDLNVWSGGAPIKPPPTRS